jgi:lysophospholipase L1-like esterase
MIREGVEFFNTQAVTDTDDGALRPERVPEAVRAGLNDTARRKYLEPAGIELRFVAPPAETVSVTLSAEGRCRAVPFYGPFQSDVAPEGVQIDGDRTTIEIPGPDRLTALEESVLAECAIDPSVRRLLFRGDPIHVHDVAGDVRPPRADECPGGTVLAYGTSITQGSSATRPHTTYVHRAGRLAGLDSLNLGTAGSAYCEAAIADHIAERDDWDVATLALSVNMLGAGFSLDTFEERTRYMIASVADANPDASVLPITLFPLTDDLTDGSRYADAEASPEAFRETLRSVVADIDRPNVRLLEGPALLEDPTGLSSDLCHPGDAGMIDIGRALAEELETEL